MGPVGAAMGAFRRVDRGMENRVQSLLKRRPNLKHHSESPGPVRKLKARNRHQYRSVYTVVKPKTLIRPLTLSSIALILSVAGLVVGIPAALTPAPYPVFRDDVVSDLSCVLVIGIPAVAASFISLVHHLEHIQKPS